MADLTTSHATIDHTGLTGVGGSVATDTIWDAAGDLAVGTGANTAAKLTKGSALDVLRVNAGGTALEWAAPAGGGTDPWLVDIDCALDDPSAATGTWAQNAPVDGGVTYPRIFMLFNSSSAQNDAVSWDVGLSAGTWKATLHTRKSSNVGIYTLKVDGSSVGTLDGYAAAAAYGVLSLAGIAIASSGQHTLQILMATKNGSSSNYVGELFWINLRRTA